VRHYYILHWGLEECAKSWKPIVVIFYQEKDECNFNRFRMRDTKVLRRKDHGLGFRQKNISSKGGYGPIPFIETLLG